MTVLVEKKSGDSSLGLLKEQRSHLLFVLCNPYVGHHESFLSWFRNNTVSQAKAMAHVISYQPFEKDPVDITMGHYPSPDYQFMAIYELCLDNKDDFADVEKSISKMYKSEGSVSAFKLWLYYPISEKVGADVSGRNKNIVVAFANSTTGSKDELREWYCTEHIRHALNIPLLLNGQCYGAVVNQECVLENFQIISIYDLDGSSQDFLEYCKSIPENIERLLSFPNSLDVASFGESVYRPIL